VDFLPPAKSDSGAEQPNVVSILTRAAWRSRHRTIAAFALLVASKLAFVAVPWLLKRIVDTFSRPHDVQLLPIFLLVGYAVLRFAGALFGELRDLVFAPVTQQTVAMMTLRVFEHLHRLGARFHIMRQTGSLIRDVERGTQGIAYLLGVALFSIAPTLVEISAVLIVMLNAYGVLFGAIIGVTFAIYVTVTVTLAERRTQLQRAVNELDAGASGRLVDSLLNHETVKACANETFEAQRLGEILESRSQMAIRSQGALSTLHISQSAVIAFGVASVMLYAGQLVATGHLSIGDLVLINAYVIQVCMPLNALGFVFREARDARTNIERMFRLLLQKPEAEELATTPALEVSAGEVRFEHVHFGYEANRKVLWDIDFRVAPGGTVAIVGGSGSGKSTLARLLLRFHEPLAGRVLIDGQDIHAVSQRSLRQAIGVVPQDTILFNDTIAYNIAYGRIGATLSEIVEAARAAHVHDFVVNLPEQYNTLVGERGLKLSGGEKQRIAIARAILRNPPLLVFDEATSALDTRAERAIQSEIERVSRDRTTLVIAHRLSTIVNADEILVMEHGRIVERGRHAELVNRGGVYAQMWSLQQQERELEHAEHRLALQPLNLATLAAAVVDSLQPLLEAKDIAIYTSLHTEEARVTGDPAQLQQVFWDLCANAALLSPAHGRIELRVEHAGPYARVTIADTRRADAPESSASPIIHHVESPLFEIEPVDPLRVRSIVEQHHGRFEMVPASAGHGTRYVIELPLRAVMVVPKRSAPTDARTASGSLVGLRVFCLDDDQDAREALVAVLEARGAAVRAFAAGNEMLAVLAAQPRTEWPDVLVCDIALSDDENGYDIVRRLRSLEEARETRLEERLPAIALSGYAEAEDRMRALLAGFQIHLAKPVDSDELATTICTLAPKKGLAMRALTAKVAGYE
jgi:ATP-binding cassette subfamily B protein